MHATMVNLTMHVRNVVRTRIRRTSRNSQQQDAVAALTLIEACLARVRAMFPDVVTVSVQSDNAAAYASPFLLFFLLGITTLHGLRITEYVHNEAGDGKTVLDGHFGVQSHMLCAYVNEGHDITMPKQAALALRHKPVRNTLVTLIDFDVARLAGLSVAMSASSVTGSAQIRHCRFAQDGSLHLSRYAGVGTATVVPAVYVHRVVGTLQPARHANGTVTGVSWEGDVAPAVVARSKNWNLSPPGGCGGKDAASNAGASCNLPFRLLMAHVLRASTAKGRTIHGLSSCCRTCRHACGRTAGV
jgi:hypothetical protein